MNDTATVPVWDIAVRIFHWSLVLFFAVSYLSGDEFETLHAYAGYVALALVLFRLVWGFVGTRYARFSNFVYPPRTVIAYLKSLLGEHPKRYLGHNPAGGAMIIALLVCLLVTCWTGLVAYGKEGHGPLANAELTLISAAHADKDEDEEHERRSERKHKEEEEFWEEIHEFFSNLTLLLVAMHIFGVALSSHLHHENLVRAMITGRKERQDGDETG